MVLKRAHTERVADEIMADDELTVVEVRLNPRHPLPDICDVHARANLWGLGPGMYPKAKAPKPPFHPFCWCKLVTRPDMDDAQAKSRPEAVRELLRTLPQGEAARILGSRDRLREVLAGGDWEKLKGVRLERVGQNVGMRNFKQPNETFSVYDAGAPKIQPDISTPARRTAVGIENVIRSDSLETGAFIGGEGQVLLKRQGMPDRVMYRESELTRMRGAVFTHNHPLGAGFSVDDVALASEFGFSELRAVTLNFRHMASGIPTLGSTQWMQAYKQAEADVVPILMEMVRLGELHPQNFGHEARHRAWATVAKNFNFLYSREKS